MRRALFFLLAGCNWLSRTPEPSAYREEIERRIREVEMENAFLKKCAAYFAKDPGSK